MCSQGYYLFTYLRQLITEGDDDGVIQRQKKRKDDIYLSFMDRS
jgi:hypothetical protein